MGEGDTTSTSGRCLDSSDEGEDEGPYWATWMAGSDFGGTAAVAEDAEEDKADKVGVVLWLHARGSMVGQACAGYMRLYEAISGQISGTTWSMPGPKEKLPLCFFAAFSFGSKEMRRL